MNNLSIEPPIAVVETGDSYSPAKTAPRTTKAATVIQLLSRNKGATLAEIVGATNWQPHSSRTFLTGLRKKGIILLKEVRRSGEASYRIGHGCAGLPIRSSGWAA